jgi:hypothetical protein
MQNNICSTNTNIALQSFLALNVRRKNVSIKRKSTKDEHENTRHAKPYTTTGLALSCGVRLTEQ